VTVTPSPPLLLSTFLGTSHAEVGPPLRLFKHIWCRSTGEKYNEKWPATPFTIRITNKAYPGHAEAQVFVDGRLAATAVGRGGKGRFIQPEPYTPHPYPKP